jgi:hypothetical protein
MQVLLDIGLRRYKPVIMSVAAAVKADSISEAPEDAAWRVAASNTLTEVTRALCLSLIFSEALSLCGYRHGWQSWVSLMGIPLWFCLRKLRVL